MILGDGDLLKDKTVKYLHDLADKIESGELYVEDLNIAEHYLQWTMERHEINLTVIKAGK